MAQSYGSKAVFSEVAMTAKLPKSVYTFVDANPQQIVGDFFVKGYSSLNTP